MKNLKENIFVLAGMPRASSTFMYFTLAKHPEIFVTAQKEIDYFSNVNFYKGEDWYLNLFSGIKENQVGLDCTPVYFMDNEAIKRMKEFNPNIKVVLIIRNPAGWAISFYKQMKNIAVDVKDFKTFIKNGLEYNKEGRKQIYKFNNNFVKTTIQKFIDSFQSNLLLIDFKLIEQNPSKALNAIENFVGISNYFTEQNVENIKINASNKISIPIISYLKRNKFFVNTVIKLFPRNFIFSVSEKLNKLLIKNIDSKSSEDNFDIDFLKEEFKEDIEFVNNLFNKEQIVIPK